jgi:protein ImuB
MDRILCVWLPNWAIDTWRRRNPSASPADLPAQGGFALIAQERGVRRLSSLDAVAAAFGLFVGQKAADASALAPGLTVADADPEADRTALIALADWCCRFSPAVAVDGTDGLVIDITGVAHLWGGEAAMVEDLVRRLSHNGLTARAAVAGNPAAAWALARFAPDRTIVAEGGEAEALARLPVTALLLEATVAAQIVRLGLTTIGRLAALPRDAVTRRFGAGVVARLDQAQGRAGEALTYRRPPTPWLARLAFADPISAPEDMARVTADIAALLCARLEAEGRGARRFELVFHRLDGRALPLTIGLALPGRDARAIARLFSPLLETVDPGFGIEVVTLTAAEVEARGASQRRLEQGGEVSPEEGVAPLVDRLVNRLGGAAVWRAEPNASHAPERAVARRPALSPSLSRPGGGGWSADRPRPLRLFRRPEPIDAMSKVPDDPPIFFRWRGVAHRVRLAEGPERLAEEWWRRPLEDDRPSRVRDYYRVEDDAGARFWVYRDGLYGGDDLPKWWVHGLFG